MSGAKIEKFKKGKLLFAQGSKYNHIYLIQSGAVEILAASSDFNGVNPKLLLNNSKRITLINRKTFVTSFHGKTVRAVTDCKAQKIDFTIAGIKKFAAASPGQAISLLHHLFQNTEAIFSDYQKALRMYQTLCKVHDNMSVLFSELSARELPPEIKHDASEILQKVNRSQLPPSFEVNFLVADRSELYGKSYDIPGEKLESFFNKEQYSFFKRFLKVDKNIFGHLIKADPHICTYMYSNVNKTYTKIIERIYKSFESIDQYMDRFFASESSWLETLFKNNGMSDLSHSGRLSPSFEAHFGQLVSKIYQTYTDITGINAKDKYPSYEILAKYLKENTKVQPKAGGTGAASQSSDSPDNIKRLYENSLHQIFQFAVADDELQRTLLMAMGEFKKMENPFTTESDGRKIRRQITKLYWDLYSLVYIRSKSVKQIPAPVKLMLKFGFLDENIVDPEQIAFLHNNINSKAARTIPVLYESEFLDKIYEKTVPPSINEMGLTYEKYLREMGKSRSRKGPDPMDDIDDPVKMVMYEITNMLQSTVGVCSGSRSTSFPIFTNQLIKGNLDNFIVTKEKVESIVSELLKIDYSAFYRETILKLDDAREIIEEEIRPYFLLLPSYGTKVMMWQELSGTNKRSRARIVIPVFFMGDLFKSIAHAVAAFRWELTRTMKGGMWADPVEGGLTGAYVDYVQFLKKNTKLSTEAKAKVAERLKACRNNPRELFAEDYIMWTTYERQGIMKMNTVSRDLFYRYTPFPEELRNRLSTMPAFSESANRFKNIRARTVTTFERKFRKYRDDNGNLPEPIDKYLKYLEM